jgi:transglutaminase-like putative cysteine protease
MGSNRRTIAAAIATILATVSLYPIFIGFSWFLDGIGAVATIAIAGTLTRLRRLPLLACLAGGLAALLLFLNCAFESGRSRYLIVPTPGSLHALWDLAGTGFNQAAIYAPPVPELSGMMLITTAGIGLTALLTDFIAVRLESAALAGLPLLLLFTEPFTLSISRSGVGTILSFCLGTAGYLGLLSSEGRDRIKEWERPDPSPSQIPDTRALTTAGRRVGVAAVALALCLPVFVPGLHTTRLFGGQPGIGGTPGAAAGGGVGFPNPNTQLSKSLHETSNSVVLVYSTTDPTPQYFQIYVLDNLTDAGWQLFSQPESLVSASQRLPVPPGLTAKGALVVHTAVSLSQAVGQDDLSALPVPYPATSVSAPGNLQADKNSLMVFDNGEQFAGLRYSVTSLDESPSGAALNQAQAPAADIVAHYTQVPSSYKTLLGGLARSIAGSAKTPYQKALAIQDWLTNGTYTYTLNAPTILSAQALKTFLTQTRRGYCQQFSFAMAVLARLLGIPSRVAYGYTGGSLTSSGTYEVTEHDAHAWPELYFQGFGWLRFEPTPTGADGQGTASAPTYTLQPVSAFQQGSTSVAPTTAPTSASNSHAIPPGFRDILPVGGISGGLAAPARAGTLSPWQIAGLVVACLLGLLLLASAAPSIARVAIRRRRWRVGARGGDAGLANAAWRELRDDLVDYRAGYQPSESPRALAARVGPGLELTGPAVADHHGGGARKVCGPAGQGRRFARGQHDRQARDRRGRAAPDALARPADAVLRAHADDDPCQPGRRRRRQAGSRVAG